MSVFKAGYFKKLSHYLIYNYFNLSFFFILKSNNIVKAQNLLASPTSRKSMSFFSGTLDSSRLNWDNVPVGPTALNYANTARRTPTFAATGTGG